MAKQDYDYYPGFSVHNGNNGNNHSRDRNPVEDCFWRNAAKIDKEKKVLQVVNNALEGDVWFHSYEGYLGWVKSAINKN